MPHQYHAELHKPRNAQYASQSWKTAIITETVTHTPSPWAGVGSPMTTTRGLAPVPAGWPTSVPYPPVRQQRPSPSYPSQPVVSTTHPHTTHKETPVSPSPSAMHHQHQHQHQHQHHHKAKHSTKVAKSSSAPGAVKTSPNLAPAAHRHGPPAGLHKNTQDQGMSSGAKAGIAIGLLLAFAMVGAVIFFVYRRKKNQNDAHQPLDDEKSNLHNSQRSLSSHVSVRRTVANAPRLSLRPVTEMFPAMTEKHDNPSASTLIAKSAASARVQTPEAGLSNQTSPSGAANPFGDDAEAPNNAEQTTLTAPAAVVPKPLSVKSERTASALSDRPSPQLIGQASAAANVNAARRLSPPGPGPNNVHRVQLDFNPSMDDELGLRAGQLVRMLHEYDDGWALCIRLDRSQQGVVPRTCISKLPVKPRPQGPSPNMRGPPPQGRPRGPSNGPVPNGHPNDIRHRPMIPPNGRMRSQSNSPHHPRPQSPGPFGGPSTVPQARPRANSDAMSARRITPPSVSPPSSAATSPTQGGSVPNRKPVPGQAL